MSLRKQIKQKVMKLAYRAEQVLHRLQEQYGPEGPTSDQENESTKKSDPGQIRTYYNNSKEERKLH